MEFDLYRSVLEAENPFGAPHEADQWMQDLREGISRFEMRSGVRARDIGALADKYAKALMEMRRDMLSGPAAGAYDLSRYVLPDEQARFPMVLDALSLEWNIDEPIVAHGVQAGLYARHKGALYACPYSAALDTGGLAGLCALSYFALETKALPTVAETGAVIGGLAALSALLMNGAKTVGGLVVRDPFEKLAGEMRMRGNYVQSHLPMGSGGP